MSNKQPANYACNEPDYIPMINNKLDTVMNHYSRFLDDGDFEKYMPMIHSPDPRELTRIAWIMNRFTEYGSEEWNLIHSYFTINYNRLES